jgi:23S rRNA (uracil-5-)-methyltransferase RumA
MERSPDRVAPVCPHFLQGCGGCQLQHVDYAAQVRTKERLFDQELTSAGIERRVDRVWAMTEPWRYRRTTAIAIGWEAGFRPRERHGIVEVRDCSISHPIIGAFCDRLNVLLRALSLPNYHGKVWLDCTVVGRDQSQALQVVIQAITGLTLETHPELSQVATTLAAEENVESVAYRHRSGKVIPLIGDPMGTVEVAGRAMFLPAGSFFQTNLEMLAILLRRVRSILTERDTGPAADVYGGVGMFGLALADLVDTMTIVELDGEAIEAARRTAHAWGITNVSFASLHAERALPSISSLDMAIVDPPRSGLGASVVGTLTAKGVPLILYVSCSPQSLAQDLVQFQSADYRIESLEIFDFYPQTYHVESLAVLAR